MHVIAQQEIELTNTIVISKHVNKYTTGPTLTHVEIKYTDPIYQLLRSGRIWHKIIFKRSLTGLNSEFSFS